MTSTGLGWLWLLLLAVCSAAVVPEGGAVAGDVTSALEDCAADGDAALCLKTRAVELLDRALRAPELSVYDGVSLVGPVDRSARALDEASLPPDPEQRDAEVENLLVDRVGRFLQSRTLQLRLPGSAVEEVRRSLDEARGKKKKKLKMLLPLLLLLKMKAAALIPLALGALALLALKALVVGKLALLLAGIIGLQKLLGNRQTTQTYEVVAHPTYSHSHVSSYGDEHGGHYGRSMADPQDLAYSAHKPE